MDNGGGRDNQLLSHQSRVSRSLARKSRSKEMVSIVVAILRREDEMERGREENRAGRESRKRGLYTWILGRPRRISGVPEANVFAENETRMIVANQK